MIKILFISIFLAVNIASYGQIHKDILNLKPDSAIQGIKVQKISNDKNSTSFIIWIENEVKAHKHESHTENIYILEGEGEMKLNGNIIILKSGDYINVPEKIIHSVKVTSSQPMKVLSVQSPEFTGEDRVFVEE